MLECKQRPHLKTSFPYCRRPVAQHSNERGRVNACPTTSSTSSATTFSTDDDILQFIDSVAPPTSEQSQSHPATALTRELISQLVPSPASDQRQSHTAAAPILSIARQRAPRDKLPSLEYCDYAGAYYRTPSSDPSVYDIHDDSDPDPDIVQQYQHVVDFSAENGTSRQTTAPRKQ